MKQKGHVFSHDILKACDIRGIYNDDLSSLDAYHIGRAFGTTLIQKGSRKCVLGYDGRLSSPELANKVIDGLRECGIDIILLGLAPTPMLYFAVKHLHADAGVIVTASHNPAEYNGFKFVLQDELFHGESIQELARISKERNYIDIDEVSPGSVKEHDIRLEYVSYLHSFLQLPFSRDLTIIWDPGNGAAAAVLPDFLADLPGRHEIICGTVDGTFPNHHPDPSLPKNMIMLQKAVIKTNADCGIAFDGDGDRLGVVDGKAVLLQGDQLLTIFAREYLKRHPGKKVMSEVKASKFFYDDVKAHGGTPLMWKVGHSNQKEKMLQEGIELAGETSGHIFFSENFGFDDGLFASVKLLNVLGNSSRKFADITAEFPKLFDSGEIRLKLSTSERKKLIQEVVGRMQEAHRDIITLDGIRAACEDGFWMLRGSNTQPHITIRCEAATKQGLEICLQEVKSQIELSGFNYEHLIS